MSSKIIQRQSCGLKYNGSIKLLVLLWSITTLIIITPILLFHFNHWYINTTNSMHLGIWYIQKSKKYYRGDTVAVCPPNTRLFQQAKKRHYLDIGFTCPHHYSLILKPIAAVSYDSVLLTKQGVSVNNQNIAKTALLSEDNKNQPIAHYPFGYHQVKPNEVWLIANQNSHSYDSRYFGPISTKKIIGIAKPVFIY